METKKELVKIEIQSLNQELYNDLSIEELEKRLEFGLWCDCNGAYCPNLTSCGTYPAT